MAAYASIEQSALLSLVQHSEGKAWSANLKGWSPNSGIPTCDWEGVTCRINMDDTSSTAGQPPNAVVAELALPSLELSGTIPTELGMLSELEHLILKNNMMRGSIPQEIANLKKLVTLDLTECFLTGTLPQRFESSQLTTLLLANNAISGRFFETDDSPHLSSIKEIRMENNLLTGTLHGITMMQMPQLDTLSLSANDLSGLIPGEELGSLPALHYLYVDTNHFVGPLPSQLAQVGRSQLLELWVQDNALSGTVPASYVRFDKLHDFFVDGNKLTGALPPDLCGPEINSDFFIEAPPEAEHNYCDSIACPAGSVAFEGVYPCEKCPGGEAARLKNRYLGQTGSCSDYEQRDVLMMFYDATTKGGAWNGVSDWGDEGKEVCDMTGITCDAHGNVVEISLKNRRLEGHIPEEIGFLSFLESMDVSDNHLMGYVPSDLQWTSMTRLDISGNRIKGIVPPLMCMMEELNGNGEDNVFYCDRIACPEGTYNRYGYHHGVGGETCEPCYDESPFIAQKACILTKQPTGNSPKFFEKAENASEEMGLSAGVALGLLIGLLPIVAIACFWIVRCVHNSRDKQYDTMTHTNGTYYSDDEEDDEVMDDYSFNVPGENSRYRDREHNEFVIADEYGDDENNHDAIGGGTGFGAESPADYDNDNASRASTTRSATEFMNNHQGMALNRREKLKKAFSQNLSPNLSRRVQGAASSLNVGARRMSQRRQSSEGGNDDRDERCGDGGTEVELARNNNSRSSEELSLTSRTTPDKNAYNRKQLQPSDLLDVPMIT